MGGAQDAHIDRHLLLRPDGRTHFSWMALRHLVEEQGPPVRGLEEPRLVRHRPVKLPFLCPKNSLSKRSCGMAPQLTGTNGWPDRGP